MLDPTLARTYVGRIVFAGFCDKLFDIDEKLNIVPQLALHETSADGKAVTIKLRPGVKFQDGEMSTRSREVQHRAPPAFPGSFAAKRTGRAATSRCASTADHTPASVGTVLAAGRPARRPRRHDGLAQGRRRRGDKFGLHPVCAGPYKFVERVQQDRIVFEKFADYWNKDKVYIDRIAYLPIVDATVRLANLKSGGLDLIERVLATDIRTRSPIPRSNSARRVSSSAIRHHGATSSDKSSGPFSESSKVRRRSTFRSIARRSTRSCSTASSCRATNGSSR